MSNYSQRNEQRDARRLAREQGLPYQKALAQVRASRHISENLASGSAGNPETNPSAPFASTPETRIAAYAQATRLRDLMTAAGLDRFWTDSSVDELWLFHPGARYRVSGPTAYYASAAARRPGQASWSEPGRRDPRPLPGTLMNSDSEIRAFVTAAARIFDVQLVADIPPRKWRSGQPDEVRTSFDLVNEGREGLRLSMGLSEDWGSFFVLRNVPEREEELRAASDLAFMRRGRPHFEFMGPISELHPTGDRIGVDSLTGAPVRDGRWDLPTPHMLILGRSGSGKSMLMRSDIERQTEAGRRCFIVTPYGRELDGQVSFLGDRALRLPLGVDFHLDLLDYRPSVASGMTADQARKRQAMLAAQCIQALIRDSGETLNAVRRRAVYQALGYLYHRLDQAEAAGEAPVLPRLGQLVERLDHLSRTSDDDLLRREVPALVQALRPYVDSGLHAAFYDRVPGEEPTLQGAGNRLLTVFGIDSLPREAGPMQLAVSVLLTLLSPVMEMEASSEPLMLYVDELQLIHEHWIGTEAIAQMMRDSGSRGRLAITLATQEFGIFLTGDGSGRGQVLMDMSSTRVLLSQHHSVGREIGRIAGLASLDGRHGERIKRLSDASLKTGQALIMQGPHHSWVTLDPARHDRIGSHRLNLAGDVKFETRTRKQQEESLRRFGDLIESLDDGGDVKIIRSESQREDTANEE